MPEGYPTRAQREALRLICDSGSLRTGELGEHLVAARGEGSHPAFARAIADMAGVLVWRLSNQGYVTETAPETWTTTPSGRELIACAR